MASLVIALASPKSRCGLLYARRDGDLKRAVDRGAQLGLAWYSREGWESLRELADDPWSLDDTFEDWERGALAAIRELESIGRRVRRVPIDVNALARLVPRATPPYRQCRASRIRHLPDTAGGAGLRVSGYGVSAYSPPMAHFYLGADRFLMSYDATDGDLRYY